MEQNNPQSSINRIGPWLILISFCLGLLVVASDFVYAVLTVLREPTFLSRFGSMLLQVFLISTIASAAGFTVAEVVLCRNWVAQAVLSFLRLGRWLPLFVVWASPMWWIRWSDILNTPHWSEPTFQIVIAMLPTVTFAACYFYLSLRHTHRSTSRTAILVTFIYVLSDTLIITLLLQVVYYEIGWHWFPFIGAEDMARSTAAAILLGGISFLLLRVGALIFEPLGNTFATNNDCFLRGTNWKSYWSAGLLWLFGFVLWDQFFVFIRDTFAIVPLRAVGGVGYRLLTTGSVVVNLDEPIWLHVVASAHEIVQGLLLSSLTAFVVAKIFLVKTKANTLPYGLLALAHTVPIVLAVGLLRWIGPGHWFKVVTVFAVSFLPLMRSLWEFRNQQCTSRILLSLDNALPYAFLGMLFGEMYAATAGLGFFIVVARAVSHRTEALAASMIAFGLMVGVSVTLRFAATRLIALRQVPN